jgi:hypothetical protein
MLDQYMIFKTTQENIAFLMPLFDTLPEAIQMKLKAVIEWHRRFGLPFYCERSIKIYENDSSKMQTCRFSIPFSLSYFMKRSGDILDDTWFSWCEIMNMKYEIEELCMDYMITGRGNVDLIWGFSFEDGKEIQKFYVENPELKTIVCWRDDRDNPIEYKRLDKTTPEYSAMYARYAENGRMDSLHLYLREPSKFNVVPIENEIMPMLHFISYAYDTSGIVQSKTYYIRVS